MYIAIYYNILHFWESQNAIITAVIIIIIRRCHHRVFIDMENMRLPTLSLKTRARSRDITTSDSRWRVIYDCASRGQEIR